MLLVSLFVSLFLLKIIQLESFLFEGGRKLGPYSLELSVREICVGFFLLAFRFLLARHKDTSVMIKEFLLHPSFCEKGQFFLCFGVCITFWVLWGKWNNRVFRGLERDPSDVWSLVRYYVSL